MSEPSAQFVEPQELRMLRNAFAATVADIAAIEYSLFTALRNLRSARERTQMNQAWLQAVEINIKQEQRT